MERIIRIKRRMGNKREGERENKRTGEGLNRKLFICATREKKTMRRLFGKWRRTGRLKKASLGYANGRNGAPFLQVSPPWLSRQLSTFSSSLFYFSLSILNFFLLLLLYQFPSRLLAFLVFFVILFLWNFLPFSILFLRSSPSRLSSIPLLRPFFQFIGNNTSFFSLNH